MTTDTTCRRCAATIAADVEFCPLCGLAVTGDEGSDAPGATAPGAALARSPLDEQALASLRDATLGEYEILSELGRGGMATVYLAHEIALNRKVAIKLISPHLIADHITERFLREARTAAGLSHPNLIPIFSVRATGSLFFFVMKYVAGPSLETILKQRERLPIPVIQAVLSETAAALSYAHRRQIVHRDVKPGNIMIDEDGRVVVTDFGIARDTQSTGLTGTGMAVGTPTYMSPEQSIGDPVSGASDQYSLGVVGYELLTGKVPFEAPNAIAMMYAHIHSKAAPLTDVRPDCPPQLAAAIMRMIEKTAADRWPSIDEANRAIGAPPLTADDPVRQALTGLARVGAAARQQSLPSTPQSPVPATRGIPRPSARPFGTPARGVVANTPGDSSPTLRMTPMDSAPAVELVATVELARVRARRVWRIALAAVGVIVVAIVVSRVIGRSSAPSSPPPVAPASAPATAAASPAAENAAAGAPNAPPAAAAPAPASLTPRRAATGKSASATRPIAPGPVAPAPAATPIAVAIASVEITPSTLVVPVGATGQLRATLRDSVGNTLTDRVMQWTSANADIADVSTSGRVIGMAAGSTQIIASADGRSASAAVTVPTPVAAAPPAPPPDPTPEIRRLIDAYVAAIHARNVARMIALYPALSPSNRSLWEKLFDDYADVTATLIPESVEIAPSGETAAFDVSLLFVNGREHQKILMHFQSNPERGNGGWRFRQIVQSYVKQ